MEYKNFSQKCLECKCRTCKMAYGEVNDNICSKWCEDDCRGRAKKDYELIDENECHIPLA